jgi:hypothetical protein
MHDLPLFTWQPAECLLLAFPLNRQVGKVRDVARKLLDKSTDRHAEYYRCQITDALIRKLTKLGIPERVQDEQISAFWSAVELETARLTYRGQRPGGAA